MREGAAAEWSVGVEMVTNDTKSLAGNDVGNHSWFYFSIHMKKMDLRKKMGYSHL